MIDSGWSIRFSPTPGRSWATSIAELLELLARADAREQEQARRVDRAAGDDDLAPRRDAVDAPALALHVHGDRALARELEAHGARLGLQREVGPVEDRMQVHHARRGANARGRVVADVEEAGAVAERRRVPVGLAIDAERVATGLDPVAEDRVAILLGDDRVRPRDAPVIGLHLVGPPAARARVDPVLPVAGERLEPDHRVVRGAAAEHLRARVDDVRVPARLQRRAVGQVERALEQPEPAPDQQHVVVADVGRAPLEHAHADGRILREPRGDDRAGTAAAHHHVVEFVRHARLPRGRWR